MSPTLSAPRRHSTEPGLPFVSIVVPVYNGADYLGAAIESALAQTYPNVEIVVVNDGSTDGGATEAIALSYGERIRYFWKPNGHVASALNFGIRHMQGEYFSWLSHDDIYLPNKVEAQMGYALRSHCPTVYYSDFETIDDKGRSLAVHALSHLPPAALRPSLMIAASVHGCSLLVPRQAFDQVGLFDETLRTTQDYDLWFKMATQFPFEHVAKVLIRSRIHKDQGTNSLKVHVVREVNDLYQRYLPTLRREEIAAYWPAGPFSYFLAASVSMLKRGYRKAGMSALLMAFRHSYGGTVREASD